MFDFSDQTAPEPARQLAPTLWSAYSSYSLHALVSTMIACRSEPPSILGAVPSGYRTRLDSPGQVNRTENFFVLDPVIMYGMPYRPALLKSGCSPAFKPIAETSVEEFEATGNVSTRLFQTLVAGKIGQFVIGGGVAAEAVGPDAPTATIARSAATTIDRRAERWCMSRCSPIERLTSTRTMVPVGRTELNPRCAIAPGPRRGAGRWRPPSRAGRSVARR